MKHTPQNLGISRLSEANLKAQFEAEQKAMQAHLLGHGSCPACQEEGARLIQESHRLRVINAKLVGALERRGCEVDVIDPCIGSTLTSRPDDRYPCPTCAAIEEARK